MTNIDFNAVLLILDTLSEDEYSFTELDDIVGRQFGLDRVADALVFLARHNLVAILEGEPHGPHHVLDGESAAARAADFVAIAKGDRLTRAGHFAQLSERGGAFLDLLRIGAHRPPQPSA